jgi:hypothetical protein
MIIEYTVTVTRIEKDVPFKDKEYKITGMKDDGENAYNYVYFDSFKDVSTKVYEQTVEDLEVSEIAKVVNSIGETK